PHRGAGAAAVGHAPGRGRRDRLSPRPDIDGRERPVIAWRSWGTDSGLRGSRAVRRGLILGCFLASGGRVLGEAVKLLVVEHEHWAAAGEGQHGERVELPAGRGTVDDRKGVRLALSHEMYQVAVAPRELREPDAAA